MSTEEALSVVLLAVREFNQQSADGQKLVPAPETMLFGRGGVLDSLALVHLIVQVEQTVEDSLGVTVALADERAMSQTSSPFRSIRTLAEYVASVVTQTRGA